VLLDGSCAYPMSLNVAESGFLSLKIQREQVEAGIKARGTILAKVFEEPKLPWAPAEAQ
jgi:hypothetical protein